MSDLGKRLLKGLKECAEWEKNEIPLVTTNVEIDEDGKAILGERKKRFKDETNKRSSRKKSG